MQQLNWRLLRCCTPDSSFNRRFEDSVKFCEGLWMYPATLDPSIVSNEQVYAIMNTMVGKGLNMYVGALKNDNLQYEWLDGTPWTRTTVDIHDMHEADERNLYLALTSDGEVYWRGTKNPKGVLCQVRIHHLPLCYTTTCAILSSARGRPIYKT